ncbi:hypothetical protein BDF19DRAFT_410533 [Syncephalis fuscata]|nr:hypothetical protein BDF19DRAFT_410533 [Syncephalis fuscata]
MSGVDKNSTDQAIKEQQVDLSIDSFTHALYFNIALGAALYLAFCILRPRNRNVYAPRTYLVEESKRSPALPSGPFSWILPILKAPEEELLHKIGLDAYIMVIIVPLNAVGIANNPGLGRVTMGNITENFANRQWGHLIIFIGFIGFILYTLLTEVQSYTHLRHRYLTSREHRRQPRSVTLLVTGIPEALQSESKLYDIFNVFPGGVSEVVLARNPGGAVAKYNTRNGAALSLEAAECDYVLSGERPITHHNPGFPAPIPKLGEAEDAIKYSRARLLECEKELEKERSSKNTNFQPSAFVIFNTQRGAQLAAQAVTSSKPLHMSERWTEVHPDDVIWSNLTIGGIYRWGRKAISILACTGLILAWMVITFFVSSLAQLSNLYTILPFLKGLENHPQLVSTIQGILPPVALAVVMMVLSFILLRFSIFEGTPLNTAVQASLIHKYFFFLVVNLLYQLPVASSLSGAAKELLMVVPFVLKWIKRRALVKTPRHIWELKAMPSISWGQTVPQHTLVFVIGMTYSVIAPLVLPFALLYFVFYYIVYRYQFLYILDQPSHAELGGRAFTITVSHIFVGLYISELTMLGIFILNKNVAQLVLMFFPIVATIIVNLYIEHAFRDLLTYVPVETLLKADRGGSMPIAKVATAATTPVATEFKHPALKFSSTHLSDGTCLEEGRDSQNNDEPTTALLGQNDGSGLVKVSRETYLHPALSRPCPVIWLPNDKKGHALSEQNELLNMGIIASVDGAIVRDSGKVGLVIDDVPLADEDKAIEKLKRRVPSMKKDFADFGNHPGQSSHQESHTETTTTRRTERGSNGEQIIIEETVTTTTGSNH